MQVAILVVVGVVCGLVVGWLLARGGRSAREELPSERTPPEKELQAVAAGDRPEEIDDEAGDRLDPEPERPASIEDELRATQEQSARLTEKIEQLETELLRYRRCIVDQLRARSVELAASWQASKLPMRVHDLNGQLPEETMLQLRSLSQPMAKWMGDFRISDAEISYQLGMLASLDERWTEAVDLFQSAAHGGYRPDGWLALGDVLWQLSRRKKAARAYEQCLEAKRMPGHVFHRCAEVAAAEGRPRDGLEILARIMDRKTIPAETYVLSCALYERLGDHEAAVAACQKGLERHPESALIRAVMILPLARSAQWERAEGCAAKARELDPQLAQTPLSLAIARLEVNELDLAERLLEEAARLDDTNAEVWLHLGIAANRRGDFKIGLDKLRQAVKLRPDLAEAHLNMKDAYEGLRDYDNAIAAMKRAVQLNPQYS